MGSALVQNALFAHLKRSKILAQTLVHLFAGRFAGCAGLGVLLGKRLGLRLRSNGVVGRYARGLSIEGRTMARV